MMAWTLALSLWLSGDFSPEPATPKFHYDAALLQWLYGQRPPILPQPREIAQPPIPRKKDQHATGSHRP